MPLSNRIYFAQIAAGKWADWVQVININTEEAKVSAVARDRNGLILWTSERTLRPYQGWVVPVEPASVHQDLSLVVASDKPIVGERHCHLGTEVLAFPGASLEAKTAGKRLFFPELVEGCLDVFIVFNISEDIASIDVIVRDRDGNTKKQFNTQLRPWCSWVFGDQDTGNLDGTVEVVSTQNIVAERHLHYRGKYHPDGVAVGQLGQVLD